MALLETASLNLSIAGHAICQNLNLRLEPGQCWGLLGRNGAGKTTLLHTLAGLRRPDAGHVRLDGRDLSTLSRRTVARSVGLLLQDSSDPFPATVLETALLGRHPHRSPWQGESILDRAMARDALTAVDLDGFEDRLVQTLSGGERRRLAMASLITQAPRLWLLDEPTNHLDLHHQISLLDTVTRHASTSGGAVVMILHDINLAVRYCEHLLLLFGDGRHHSGTSAEVLDEKRLESLYGHPLMRIAGPRGDVWLPR